MRVVVLTQKDRGSGPEFGTRASGLGHRGHDASLLVASPQQGIRPCLQRVLLRQVPGA